MNTHSKLLSWLEHQVGFENYKHLVDRSLMRIAPFFQPWIDQIKNENIQVITICGTNGKGQTSYSCAQLLKNQNKSYSLFISPHVHSIFERFQNEKGMYDEKTVEDTFLKINFLMNENNITLSFFEFLFAVFLDMAISRGSHFLILEVGVGGRLDATNLVNTDVAIITSIGRDHQELLGNRLESILKEKLGIIRKDIELYSYFNLNYLKNIALEICIKNKTQLIDLKTTYCDSNNVFDFSQINRLLAYKAVESLLKKNKNFNKDTYPALSEFMSGKSELPGRGEKIILNSKQTFYLYGSHNVDGMRAWFTFDLKQNSTLNYDLVILGFSKRKFEDIAIMIKQWRFAHLRYHQKYKKILITSYSHTKAFAPSQEEERKICDIVAPFAQTIFYSQNWKEYERFLTIRDNINILVIGSFYFVSEVRLSQS